MDMVSFIIIVVVLICVGVILGFMCVCLESERAVREKRVSLRTNRQAAKVLPIEHEEHEDLRRVA